MRGSETCLYLNIHAHKDLYLHAGNTLTEYGALTDNRARSKVEEREWIADEDNLLPVAVYIHGGDLTMGTGAVDGVMGLDPREVARSKRVISVTINYRLAIFGFLNWLDGEGHSLVPPNLGIQDMIESLRWVKKHIKAFGGDPNRVTVYGQSSGGTAILALLRNKVVRDEGLLHNAWTMSASPNLGAAPKQSDAEWQVALESVIKAYCPRPGAGKREILECLKKVEGRMLLGDWANAEAYLDGSDRSSSKLPQIWELHRQRKRPEDCRKDVNLITIDGEVVAREWKHSEEVSILLQ